MADCETRVYRADQDQGVLDCYDFDSAADGWRIVWGATLAAKSKTTSHIAVLTSQLQLGDDLKQELQHGKDSQMTVDILPPRTSHALLDQEMANKELDGYLVVVPATDVGRRPTFDFTPRSTADIATSSAIEEGLHHVLTKEYLAQKGVSESETAALLAPVTLNILERTGCMGTRNHRS